MSADKGHREFVISIGQFLNVNGLFHVLETKNGKNYAIEHWTRVVEMSALQEANEKIRVLTEALRQIQELTDIQDYAPLGQVDANYVIDQCSVEANDALAKVDALERVK